MLTQEAKENALEIFKKLLESATDNGDLKINITTETLLQQQGIEKPTIFIDAAAYCKMTALINSSSDELAWYGIATRAKNNYYIADILVYPQTVTSATVDADEEKCAKWFMELPDDVINNLKFQGHSHVNMGASPSGRDTNNWQQFANLLKPNEFMILCIGNKKGDFYWNIYDKAINVFFENKDITMCVVDSKGNSITSWANDSIKQHIVKETPKSYLQSSFYSTDKITINNRVYETTETAPAKINVDKDDKYKEMLSYIPTALRDEIEYEAESDVYIAYTPLSGFYYSSLYNCYVSHGVAFRKLHPKLSKNPVGRPKKEKTGQAKKGVKK